MNLESMRRLLLVLLLGMVLAAPFLGLQTASGEKNGKDVDSLIKDLKNDNSTIRANAAWALGDINDTRAVDPLIQALKDKDGEVRRGAASSLGDIGNVRAVDPLIQALEDKDSGVRQWAAVALGKIKDPRAVAQLIDALKDSGSLVRRWAASSLGHINDSRAVEPLIQALKDSNSEVRDEAAIALAGIKDPRAFEPLIQTFKDQSVRNNVVVIALYIIGEPAVESLIKALEDKNSDIRRWSAIVLGLIKDTRAIEPLKQALNDENSVVRTAAKESLEKIGPQPTAPQIPQAPTAPASSPVESRDMAFKSWGAYKAKGDYFIGYVQEPTQNMVDAGEQTPYLYEKSSNKDLQANGQAAKILIDGRGAEVLNGLLRNSTERTITSGNPLMLEEGYQLAIKSIDTVGIKVYLELSKNGQVVDSKVIQPSIKNARMADETYYYKADVGKTKGIVQIAVHFRNAFRGSDTNIGTIDGVFQLSDSPIDLGSAPQIPPAIGAVPAVHPEGESSPVMIGSDQVKLPSRKSLIETSDWGEVPANQVIVMLKEGKGRNDADRLASSLGGQVVGFFNYINLYQIETSGTTEAELKDSVAKAKQDPDVELAFPNQQSYPDATVQGVQCSPLDDPVYTEGGRGKGYEMIGVQRAWDLMRASGLPLSDVNVGVVDDGLYKGNGEFEGDDKTKGKVKIDTSEPNSKLEASLGIIKDANGNIEEDYTVLGSHGTGVMNLIAADPDNGGITGIASGALRDKLKASMINGYAPPYGNNQESAPDPNDPTKVVKTDGKTYTFGDFLAINKSINSGAKIISCSWGNSNAGLGTAAVYKRFFEKMANDHPDVLFVCSAGNDGKALDGSHRYPSGLNLPNMITVGNVMNEGTKATSSNMASKNFEVTLAAPGSESVYGFDNQGGIVNKLGGTSMATPQVTCAAALIRALNPKLTAGEIKDILVQNARSSVEIDGKKVPAPPELGGRILAIDQAVFKAINDQRKKLGLVPFQDIDSALGSARIDLVAENDPASPNDWKVTAKVSGVGANGADVTFELQGEGSVGGNTKQHLTQSGSLTWSVTPKDSASIVVKRLDTSGCSRVYLAVPTQPAPQSCNDVDYSKLTKTENDKWAISLTDFSGLEVFYQDSKGFLQGPYITYWDNTRKRIEDSGCYLNDEKTGHWIRYYNNGNKREEGDYKDDKKTGHWIYWHENGIKSGEGDCKDDKQTGYWTFWYDNGNKSGEGDYNDVGKETGNWITYSEDGKVVP